MKICPCGNKETTDNPFYANSSICRECYKTRRSTKHKQYRRRPEVREIYNTASRERRQNPLYRSRIILRDSRESDRKAGRQHNLALEFIESLIASGCSYCGELTLKMTLDRKDNSTGHTHDNVVASCVRCNYIRRDMPYEAWLLIVPSIKRARELGLFGSWTCEVAKRKMESKAG